MMLKTNISITIIVQNFPKIMASTIYIRNDVAIQKIVTRTKVQNHIETLLYAA